jgi:hypothetical protein
MQTPEQHERNVAQIFLLLKASWESFERNAGKNMDPDDPQTPILQVVGTTLVRIPFSVVWNEICTDSYYIAHDYFGWKGDYSSWAILVAEYGKRKALMDELETIKSAPERI